MSLYRFVCACVSVVLLTLSSAVPAQARILHVCKGPLPGVAGDSLFNTIDEAVRQLTPGDTVLIHGGVYRERVTIEQSGTPDRPIMLRAAEGEHVVLTGADQITDWQRVSEQEHIYATDWPHRFVTWNERHTHPHDDYHRLIGRCEQVFIGGYKLNQVLEREELSRGTFHINLDEERLSLWPANNTEINRKSLVEASVRYQILVVKGDHIHIKGLRFRYAANRAQQGAVMFAGDHLRVEDCGFEYSNASGAAFSGEQIQVRNCVFQYNGQLGFGANRAHGLQMAHCTVRHNNTKGFNRGWEAGGNKICLTRGVVIRHSSFVENRGHGIWFDIGNEDCEVHNCYIAHNEDAGIFYEISYGLHAHDNVILGNGFALTPGQWGAAAGISLSSSPDCTIERNLMLGNKEGFNFREQVRTTPRINGTNEPVWNRTERVLNNVLAFNRDAQVWGWFDIADERHWPCSLQTAASRSGPAQAESPTQTHPVDLSLEDLNIIFKNNVYGPAPGQGLFNWGVTWKRHKRYEKLDAVRQTLSLDQGSRVVRFEMADYFGLDLRVPSDSPALQMHCYPRGPVPTVRLGTLP